MPEADRSPRRDGPRHTCRFPAELEQTEGPWLETNRWPADRGLDQWQYPPRGWRTEEAIEAGDWYLAFRDGQAVATITVHERAGPEWWSEDDPASVLHVHDLVVSRAVAGRPSAYDCWTWQSDRANRRLRLEAWKTNQLLHGVTNRTRALPRIVDLPHRNSGVLFQRAVPPEMSLRPVTSSEARESRR